MVKENRFTLAQERRQRQMEHLAPSPLLCEACQGCWMRFSEAFPTWPSASDPTARRLWLNWRLRGGLAC